MSAETIELGHWSDCSVHNEPAYSARPCDCGGLDLAAYEGYMTVFSLVPTPRRLARFVRGIESPCAIEPEQSELGREAGFGTVPLPSPHHGVSVLGSSHGMDLDQSGVPVIADGKAPAGLQRVAGDMPPHSPSPNHKRGECHDPANVPNVSIVPVP